MKRFALSCSAIALLTATPSLAGDDILYDPHPDWVEITEIDGEDRYSDSPFVLVDQQARIEAGQLWTYVETAIALDTPQALTQFGTLSASWLPDKGDLIIHRAELLRGAKVIDLLAEGGEFEVLRREEGLESRLLDGVLTATMTVPGAQLGDTIRLAYSTTTSDQAMGDNVQWQSSLPARPAPIGSGRVSISWPKDMPISRKRLGEADVADPGERQGYMVWSTQIPVSEPKDKPLDAPFRYLVGELMQVSTYPDWSSVSSQMATHYSVDNAIKPGGELAAEIADIAAASDDPLTRAALALRLVQDDISYLMNGLNGGNYLPQSPEETWEKRFGDCKAKSVLLLAMLRELGVDAEVALVRSRGGDALPILAPMPGNFDHMIVRAEIGGKSFWLDGTVSGTRLDTIDIVPRFDYALPLRMDGAELIPLEERPSSIPDQVVRLQMDQSAGIRLPALINIEIELRGARGAQWRPVAEQADAQMAEDAIDAILMQSAGETLIIERSVSYDAEAGVARLKGRGIQASPWSRDRTVYELEPPAQTAKNVSFESDRARAAWREIPLRLNSPIHFASEFEIDLPSDSGEFEIEGSLMSEADVGGVELSSVASMEGNRVQLSQTMRSVRNELPASQISAARRNLTRFDRALPIVKAPSDIRQLWEYFGDDRARLAALEDAYSQAIAKAEPDETLQLLNRARFRSGVYDHAGAMEDIEAAIAIEASRDLYIFSSYLRRELGDLEGALEDLKLSEDLQPDGSTYETQIEILALLGRADEGLALAEDFRGLADNPVDEDTVLATALGWSGSIDAGIEVLSERSAQRPGDGNLLNNLCWYSATWNVMDESRLQTCIDAVEKSDFSPAALDSRALAHLRLGNLDAAKADIDAALLAEPSLAASRLLRGIVRKAQGDASGREEIQLALKMQPSLARTYRAWGLDFD